MGGQRPAWATLIGLVAIATTISCIDAHADQQSRPSKDDPPTLTLTPKPADISTAPTTLQSSRPSHERLFVFGKYANDVTRQIHSHLSNNLRSSEQLDKKKVVVLLWLDMNGKITAAKTHDPANPANHQRDFTFPPGLSLPPPPSDLPMPINLELSRTPNVL